MKLSLSPTFGQCTVQSLSNNIGIQENRNSHQTCSSKCLGERERERDLWGEQGFDARREGISSERRRHVHSRVIGVAAAGWSGSPFLKNDRSRLGAARAAFLSTSILFLFEIRSFVRLGFHGFRALDPNVLGMYMYTQN